MAEEQAQQRSQPARHRVRRPDRLVIGGALVILGVLYLLELADAVDAGQVVRDWWPVILVALGAAQLIERPRSIAGPIALMVAGGIVLLFTLDLVSGSVWQVIWPALLVVAGVALIVRSEKR
jgi:hypothetical protein